MMMLLVTSVSSAVLSLVRDHNFQHSHILQSTTTINFQYYSALQVLTYLRYQLSFFTLYRHILDLSLLGSSSSFFFCTTGSRFAACSVSILSSSSWPTNVFSSLESIVDYFLYQTVFAHFPYVLFLYVKWLCVIQFFMLYPQLGPYFSFLIFHSAEPITLREENGLKKQILFFPRCEWNQSDKVFKGVLTTNIKPVIK